MMENECYIVRDLLPSYIDHLCSKETSKFVEKHIAACEQCAQYVHQMRAEFNIQEQVEITKSIEQKKPFQKIAHFFKSQKSYTTFLRDTFWISLVVTVGFLMYSLIVYADIHREREEAQAVEQEKQDIIKKSFAVLSTQNNIDESALRTVFQEYSGHLQHLAVYSTENLKEFTRLENGSTYPYPIDYTSLQEGPKNIYPINYSQAVLVVGKNGKITESIIPNDYDIGTVAMANDQWIVQYEYQKSYLETVENAHQTKHYGSSNWIVFQLPIIFLLITLFILGNWLFQKRITKPVKNMLN